MMDMLLKNCGAMIWEGDKPLYLPTAYLGISGDTITYLGSTPPPLHNYLEKDMGGALLIPGLINCHCHSPMVLLRGVGSDLTLQQWLFERMMPVEARMTPEHIAAGTSLAILEMLASGTTSFSDMYMQAEASVTPIVQSGMKANLCLPIQCFDPAAKYERSEEAKQSVAFHRNYHGHAGGRIHVDFAIHAEYTCTPEFIQGYSADCHAAGGRMHLHLSETQKEHEECIQRHGKTPARIFYDLGTFDSPTAAAHCVWVSKEDQIILKEKGVSVAHNPSSNMKLASGFAPVPELLANSVNVTLGTDGAASNNNLNMFEELHLASIIHKGFRRDATLLNAAQILHMATRAGALLQGRPDTGVLQVGKKADIVAVGMDRPHMHPNLDPISLLVYAAQGSDVQMTMVDGKILYENGTYLTMDADRIYWEVEQAVRALY